MRSASGIIISLPHDHTAKSVNTAVTAAFAAMPAHMKRTLTWDQGVEMARHQELTAATGVPVFFAERSSPWQRGANENYNGLVRQYFPKATNLAVHPPVRRLRHRGAQRPPPKRARLRHSSSPLRHRNGGQNNPLR